MNLRRRKIIVKKDYREKADTKNFLSKTIIVLLSTDKKSQSKSFFIDVPRGTSIKLIFLTLATKIT